MYNIRYMKTLAQYARLFQAHTVQITGSRVFYREANPSAKRTIIVVHGITGTHYSMLQAAGVWAESSDHVIVLDLPGHGKSDKIPIKDFTDLADWLHQFIEQVFPNGDFLLMGNSFGSNICAAYAQTHGLRGNSTMVLGAPIPRINRLLYPIERLTARLSDKIAMQIYYTNPLVEPVRISILLARRRDQELRLRVQECMRSEGPLVQHSYAFGSMMPANYTYKPFSRPVDSNLKDRVLAVIGKDDTVAGRKSAEVISNWLGSDRVIVVPKCGHLVHIEAVPELTKAIDILWSRFHNG